VNKPSIEESFNNIFINKGQEIRRSKSKKTYGVTKNSPSEFTITPFAKKVFANKYKNEFNINDEAILTIKPQKHKEVYS
jgi:hypothetical protein